MKISKSLISSVFDITRSAGEILLGFLGKQHEYKDKPDGSFATEADLASEKFLKERLSKLMPKAGMIAEESGISGNIDNGYAWVIDPLDGTTNFSKQFPYFAVNIALTFDTKPILGVTYNPVNNEFFHAILGEGAYLNDKAISVSSQNDVSRSVCSLGVPCRKVDCDDFHQITKQLSNNVSSIRKLGSASLDLAGVACGRLDGTVLKYVSWWDIAAGMLLVSEAGGEVSEFDGSSLGPNFGSALGSNGLLHSQFQKLLS